MGNSWRNSAVILLTTVALSACGSDSGGPGQSGDGKPAPSNRVNWSAVPSEFNPRMEDVAFQTSGFDKIQVDAFGFDDDVEIIYSAETPANTGVLRIFKVWKKSASWGDLKTRPNGTTLDLKNYGSYQCSIKVTNGSIAALEGGCYVRLQIFLPVGTEIEIYNVGQLISRRFIPIDTKTFLDQIDDASFADDKFVVIENFLASYNGMVKKPALTSEQMGTVVDEFARGSDQLKALEKLHAFVTDRQNLYAMIESEFGHFDKEEARKIVGSIR